MVPSKEHGGRHGEMLAPREGGKAKGRQPSPAGDRPQAGQDGQPQCVPPVSHSEEQPPTPSAPSTSRGEVDTVGQLRRDMMAMFVQLSADIAASRGSLHNYAPPLDGQSQ